MFAQKRHPSRAVEKKADHKYHIINRQVNNTPFYINTEETYTWVDFSSI